MTKPRTLYEKIWHSHVVTPLPGNAALIYIDMHLVNEVTSPQAPEGVRLAGRTVHRPQGTMAVADHNVPTAGRAGGVQSIANADSRNQVETLERNVREFSIPYVPLVGSDQGIVPENQSRVWPLRGDETSAN